MFLPPLSQSITEQNAPREFLGYKEGLYRTKQTFIV
jgi:hypothetical protein